jgi:hypothetical protein
MSALERVVDSLVRVAARRWPANMRDEQAREWSAELHELRHDPSIGPVARYLGQLRYAWSLASSPPVEDENGVPRGWRETLPGFGHGLKPMLMLIGVAFLCTVLASSMPRFGTWALEGFRGYPPGMGPFWRSDRIDWAANAVSLAGLMIATVPAFWIGRWLGQRLPVAWAHRVRLRSGRTERIAGSAIVAPIGIAAGMLIVFVLERTVDLGGDVWLAADPVPALLLWLLMTVPLAGYVVRLVHAGRRGWAWLVAVVGTLLTLDAVAIVASLRSGLEVNLNLTTAPLWFPISLLDLEGSGIKFGYAEQGFIASEAVARMAAGSVRPLLIATVLIFGYGLRASRVPVEQLTYARVAAPALVPTSQSPAARRQRRFGAAVVGVALAAWTYTAAILTAQLTPEVDEVGEFHIWVQELREAAILAAVLGLVLMVARRGAVILPALLAWALLFTVDSVIDAVDASGPQVFLGASGVGLAVMAGSWQLSRALQPASSTEVATRRTLAGVATIAVFCAPALLFHAPSWSTRLPAGFAVATAALMALLMTVAGMSALAARARPAHRVVAAPLVAPLIVAGGLAGATTLVWGGRLQFALPVALPLVALVLAVMRWDSPARPRRSAVRWTALSLTAAPVGVLLIYLQLMVALILGAPMMAAAGYSFPADGLPYFPGALLVALPLAAIVAARVAPRQATVAAVAQVVQAPAV